MIIENLLNITNSILPFLVILTVLVFVHELGHYLVAIYNNVKVEVFSIGFGKELFGFYDKKGTRWRFSLIPLGGYVKMHGDADEASSGQLEDKSIDEKVSFYKKTVGQRSLILFAGPAANFLFSFILLVFINCYFGFQTTKPIISEVIEKSPAEQSDLRANDIILSIEGQKVKNFEDIRRIVGGLKSKNVELEIARDNKILNKQLYTDNKLLGIKGGFIERKKLSFFDSVISSYEQILFFSKATIVGIYEIFVGKRNADELGGPIRIAELSSDFWQKGVYSTLWFMVLISLNLGLINLFPIPLLDGGHLLFNFFEALNGKPLQKKYMNFFHSFGFFILISLMIFATYNDISRFL